MATPETNTTPTARTSPAAGTGNYANDGLDLAKDLAKFITDNKLSSQVQGKEFVNVEGWQYAGSRLGIVPIVETITNCSTDTELKYEAKVSLLDLSRGITVGAGFAICSNKESGKKFYQEFAICSMAQTRAIGKAYRNILAWIIRAAGYEPTPAEEMETTAAAAAPTGGAARITPAPAEQPVLSESADGQPTMQVSRPAANSAAGAVAARVARQQAGGVLLSTGRQQELIGLLLQSPAVPNSTRTTALLNYLRFTHERAQTCITRLVKTITQAKAELPQNLLRMQAAIDEEYQQLQVPGSRAAAEAQLRFFANAHLEKLGKVEAIRLLSICVNPDVSAEQLLHELEQGTDYLTDLAGSAAA